MDLSAVGFDNCQNLCKFALINMLLQNIVTKDGSETKHT